MGFILDEALKKADINTNSSGDNTLIDAQGVGTYIAVDFISFFPTTAVTVQFKSGSNSYGGPLPMDAKQTITWENSSRHQYGVITCGDNEALVMNLGGGVQVGGLVRYRIVNK